MKNPFRLPLKHRASALAACLIIAVTIAMSPNAAFGEACKKNTLVAEFDTKLESATATIGYKHTGKCTATSCSLTDENAAFKEFNLEVGDTGEKTNMLCLGTQRSKWDIQLVIGTDSKRRIKRKNTPGEWGWIESCATAPTCQHGTGQSTARTTITFRTTTASAETSEVAKENKLDDALIGGATEAGFASGRITVKLGGTNVLDVHTYLWANPGLASIDGLGLTIPSAVGTSGGYWVRVTNTQNPDQNFLWEVTALNGILSGSGAENPGWTLTPSGWMLPASSFPLGSDITCVSGAGQVFDFEALAETFAQDVSSGVGGVVAEDPTASTILGILSPNPVVHELAYTIDLPEPSMVSVEVFGISGRRVRELIRGELPSGPQKFTWIPIDENGNPLAVGLYFLRLEALGRRESRTFILTR